MMLKVAVFFVLAIVYVSAQNCAYVKLVGEKVNGEIRFNETTDGVLVEGEVRGLTKGKHGFHIHEKGDLSNGCTSTGGHFNPHKKNHGAPTAAERHVGDLGNIEADDNGIAKVHIVDSQISLTGANCIIGRGVVVHSGEDDLGLGGHDDSLTTGHAGDRVACGVIGIASDDFSFGGSTRNNLSTITIISLTIFGFMMTKIS